MSTVNIVYIMKIHVRILYLHGFNVGDSGEIRTHNLQICNLLHYHCATLSFLTKWCHYDIYHHYLDGLVLLAKK